VYELKGDVLVARLPYGDTVSREAVYRASNLRPGDSLRILRQRSILSVNDPVEVWGVEINGEEVLSYEAMASERVRIQKGSKEFILYATVLAAALRFAVSQRGLRLLRGAA
jgi:hypothetical protein